MENTLALSVEKVCEVLAFSSYSEAENINYLLGDADFMHCVHNHSTRTDLPLGNWPDSSRLSVVPLCL